MCISNLVNKIKEFAWKASEGSLLVTNVTLGAGRRWISSSLVRLAAGSQLLEARSWKLAAAVLQCCHSPEPRLADQSP